MAIKYSNYFTDDFSQVTWTINISDSFWNGGITELPLAAEPLRIVYDDVENIFNPIHESSCFINILWDRDFNPDGYKEFFSRDDKSYKVDIYADGVLEWCGWVLPEGYRENFSEFRTTVELRCTDGFSLLKIKNIGNDFYVATGGNGPTNLVDFMTEAMNVIGLGIPMRWNSLLVLEGYPETVANYVQEYINFSRASLISGNLETKSYYDAISGLLISLGHVITQSNGAWFAYQPNANVSTSANYQNYNTLGQLSGAYNYFGRKRVGGITPTSVPIDQSEILTYKDRFTNIRITAPGNLIENYFPNGGFADHGVDSDFNATVAAWDSSQLIKGSPFPVSDMSVTEVSGSPEVRIRGQISASLESFFNFNRMQHPIYYNAGLMLSCNISQSTAPNNLQIFIGIESIGAQQYFLNMANWTWQTTWVAGTTARQFDSNINTRLFFPIFNTPQAGSIRVKFYQGDSAGTVTNSDFYVVSDVVLEPFYGYTTTETDLDSLNYLKNWKKTITRANKKEVWNYKISSNPYFTTEEIDLPYGGGTSLHETNVLTSTVPAGVTPDIITRIYARSTSLSPSKGLCTLANQVARNYQACHGWPNSYDYEATVVSTTGQFIRKIDTVDINGITNVQGLETFQVKSLEFYPKKAEQIIKLTYVSNR